MLDTTPTRQATSTRLAPEPHVCAQAWQLDHALVQANVDVYLHQRMVVMVRTAQREGGGWGGGPGCVGAECAG